jgi:DNA mismatch endonuclease (patch repair protein)
MADNMTPEQRSRTMSRIRSKNTQAELTVRRILHARGLRYRVHSEKLPGKPDIVFPRQRLAVFIDGDFWHGRNFHGSEDRLSSYWREKIAGNMKRDGRTTLALQQQGWTVLRIWEKDIKKDAAACADQIESVVRKPAR